MTDRMTDRIEEYHRALRDQRADVIDEVAAAMPGAKANDVVHAITERLEQPLPRLVEVVFEVVS